MICGAGGIAGAVLLLLVVAAGRVDAAMWWAYAAAVAGLSAVALAFVDPDLLRERRRPGPGGRDAVVLQPMKLLLIGHLLLAGLDAGRLHWSDGMPAALRWAGLGAFAAGWGLAVAAMLVNRFFSTVIRLQSERGHQVITAGPYRWVRHPGYTGMIAGGLSSGLVLGSWLSLVPAAGFAAIIVRRAVLEDRFLRERLEGYAAYASRVRWRLLPGVW